MDIDKAIKEMRDRCDDLSPERLQELMEASNYMTKRWNARLPSVVEDLYSDTPSDNIPDTLIVNTTDNKVLTLDLGNKEKNMQLIQEKILQKLCALALERVQIACMTLCVIGETVEISEEQKNLIESGAVDPDVYRENGTVKAILASTVSIESKTDVETLMFTTSTRNNRLVVDLPEGDKETISVGKNKELTPLDDVLTRSIEGYALAVLTIASEQPNASS